MRTHSRQNEAAAVVLISANQGPDLGRSSANERPDPLLRPPSPRLALDRPPGLLRSLPPLPPPFQGPEAARAGGGGIAAL